MARTVLNSCFLIYFMFLAKWPLLTRELWCLAWITKQRNGHKWRCFIVTFTKWCSEMCCFTGSVIVVWSKLGLSALPMGTSTDLTTFRLISPTTLNPLGYLPPTEHKFKSCIFMPIYSNFAQRQIIRLYSFTKTDKQNYFDYMVFIQK